MFNYFGGYEGVYYVQSCDLHISVCTSHISGYTYVFFSKGDGSDKGFSANWIKCYRNEGSQYLILRTDLSDLGYTSDLLSGKHPAIDFQNIPGRFGRIDVNSSYDTVTKVHNESLDILLLNPVDSKLFPHLIWFDPPLFSLFLYDGATSESIVELKPIIRVTQSKIGWIKKAIKRGLLKDHEI